MGRVALRALVLLLVASVAAFGQVVYDGNNNLPPFGSFSGSDFDVVSLQNGNLHIHIPILEVPQRGGKPIKYFYIYDTPNWTRTYTPPQRNLDHGTWFIGCCGGGWRLSNSRAWLFGGQKSRTFTCPDSLISYSQFIYTVTDPEGASHPTGLLTAGSAPCVTQHLQSSTLDGSGVFTKVDRNGLIANFFLKDGSTFTEETNGNLIAFSSSTSPAHTISLIGADTLDRTPLTVTGSAPNPQTWTYTDSNGSTQTWTVTYTTITLASMCGSLSFCGQFPSSLTVPQTVQLPTGRSYVFKWNNNSLGELQETDLPTGGSISYTYTGITQQNPDTDVTVYNLHAGVRTRTVARNGVSATWNYNLSPYRRGHNPRRRL